ncbi:hypothetical protein N7520_002220 [Penicillium odoratum]|uniref:uncharacterized protein n=1 Tax=Penicillium odoratum TaxID=1167516 RepID=UPI0025475CF7|nr:uncharacterized protein N7520_002220 [Penicillium odoratum]KAJ5771691.1 hypothetical protein N7520_002220 [Penicillium odoratum]
MDAYQSRGRSSIKWEEQQSTEQPAMQSRRRHDGSPSEPTALQTHLEWKYRLVVQLAKDGLTRFHVVRDRRGFSSQLQLSI